MSSFVHLHCHTTYSLLDGAIPADHLPHLAAERGFEAVAMTDHDSLVGAVRFTEACRAAGVKPIYGAELTVWRKRREDGASTPGEFRRRSSERSDGDRRGLSEQRERGAARSAGAGHEHVTVIARDAAGYANLCRLITEAHLSHERGQPATTFDRIAERAEGLFVLSGCERGEVARLAAAGRMPEAATAARRWRDAIGDGYRIEVFDHRGYGDRTLRDRLLGVAREAGIRAVATNDCHYVDPVDAVTHEVLHAIKDIVGLSRSQMLRSNAEHGFKSAAEMHELFSGRPEVLDETAAIAEACDFELDLGTYHFPRRRLPGGGTPGELLARRCSEGARRRYGSMSRTVEDRLQHELDLIFEMGFAAYFLVVADIVDEVRRMGIRCACRGSAAGSLVCYVLGVSDVDPVRYDLLFERFMNTRRDELPDIDLDVESHRREEVLEHILQTYGAEQTAVCCMVDTFRARMAIREVGKALGLPSGEIDLVATAFPRIAARDIPAALERLPELAGTNLDSGQLSRLFDLCLAIDGFPRHLALHPSGVILSSPDLADRVPMQESFGGFTMLQADKDDVEALGLVKLDVLGVRMLSAMTHAISEIERATGEEIELDRVPHDDERTFELIRTSETIGCFQIESPGQRELLARFQPDRFEDLIVDISLFRPGPVKSDMVTPYLERRHGFEAIRYAHPRLAPILAETGGVIVYHEQVIRVIAAVTGCTLADADFVRRHLDALEDDVGAWFQDRAVSNGFEPAQAEALWREVFSFASFGFCKSHAAAFALPSYRSAYLKAHHPAAFLAGVLTYEPGMYPRRLIVADARKHGIPILPVDVNASDAAYRIEPALISGEDGAPTPGEFRRRPPERSDGGRRGLSEQRERGAVRSAEADGADGPGTERTPQRWGIRLALSGVRDISDAEVGSILSAREKDGPFTSLEDLWRRSDLSRPALENLVHVGALDAISSRRSRRELLWRVADLRFQPKARPGEQLALALDEPVLEALPELPAYSEIEETEAELEISGIDARRHVLELYRPLLAGLGVTSAAELVRTRNRSEVWVAGIKVASQTPAIRSGQRIIFLTLDDLTGVTDLTIFERAQPRCARTVFHSWALLARGEVRKRGGASLTRVTDPDAVGITVVVEEAFDLAEIARDESDGYSPAEALDRQRTRQTALAVPALPGKLWHSSGGSAGQ